MLKDTLPPVERARGSKRPCNACRRVFQPTTIRRMLCYACFKRGGQSGALRGVVGLMVDDD